MKKTLLPLIICFAVLATASAQTDATTLVKIGQIAPGFSCTTIDGKTIDITAMKGKIVMINFFATWCGPCNSELPVLQKNIWDKYKNNPSFQLIILGREHNAKEVSDFVKAKSFTMPFAPDPKREIYKLYATQYIPRNVIIGKNGKIIFQNMGYNEKEFKEIEELLAKELK